MKITRHTSQWFAALTMLALVASASKAMWGDRPPAWQIGDRAAWQRTKKSIRDTRDEELGQRLAMLEAREQQLESKRDALNRCVWHLADRQRQRTSTVSPEVNALQAFVATLVDRAGMPADPRMLDDLMARVKREDAVVRAHREPTFWQRIDRTVANMKAVLQQRGRAELPDPATAEQALQREAERILGAKEAELDALEAATAWAEDECRFLTAREDAREQEEARRRREYEERALEQGLPREEEEMRRGIEGEERDARQIFAAYLAAIGAQRGAVAVSPAPPHHAPPPPRRAPRAPKRRPARTYRKKPLPPRRGRLYTEEGELREKYRQ